jgi:hypothetical protein
MFFGLSWIKIWSIKKCRLEVNLPEIKYGCVHFQIFFKMMKIFSQITSLGLVLRELLSLDQISQCEVTEFFQLSFSTPTTI